MINLPNITIITRPSEVDRLRAELDRQNRVVQVLTDTIVTILAYAARTHNGGLINFIEELKGVNDENSYL